jgi:hypothetical protein
MKIYMYNPAPMQILILKKNIIVFRFMC